jgi:hypothetical protein
VITEQAGDRKEVIGLLIAFALCFPLVPENPIRDLIVRVEIFDADRISASLVSTCSLNCWRLARASALCSGSVPSIRQASGSVRKKIFSAVAAAQCSSSNA